MERDPVTYPTGTTYTVALYCPVPGAFIVNRPIFTYCEEGKENVDPAPINFGGSN